MFASLAGVLMLAQAAAPMVTGAATYSDELQGAYDYAYSKGITTMTSIDNANMYGELTRGQLSKMISQWAEKEMWVKADETASCSFSDASTAEGDLATWVVKACQMGLMGQGINAFRPNDKVTRGEFGTVLSRAIWGEKYNQENPFYAKHLQALKDAGIMTKIEEPNSLEIRGWVMLMLQRAAETVSGDDECNDPAVLLACALGSTGCPAKCAEAEKETNQYNEYEGVQAGDLNIAVSTSSNVTSIPNSGVIKVAELAVKASEKIQLQSLDVTRLGLSQNKGLKVWIEKDGRRITSSSSFFGDSVANLSFNNGGYVVNGDETLDLVVSLSGDAGSELQFKVGNVVSSSKSTSVSPDTTGVFRTTTYTVTTISTVAKSAGAVRNYDVSKDSSYSFGEFQLINNSTAAMEKDAMIKSITFKVDVNGWNIENLSQFKLLKDSKEISSKYTVDGKSITFAVNDRLDSGKSATYKVTAVPTTIETTDGDKYTLRIAKAEDIVAEEIGNNDTAFRASVKGDKSTRDFSEINLWQTVIKGGNFTLTRDSNFASNVNANWGYSDITIAKGTIKVNQSAKFEDGIKITAKGAMNTSWDDLSNIVRRASLKIGSKTYQAGTIKGVSTAAELVFDSEIYLEKGTQDVELLISLANSNDAWVEALEFADITKDSFIGSGKYINGDETPIATSQIAGSIRVAKVSIQEQKFTFKKVGPTEDVKFVENNTDERVLFAGEIINSQDKDLDLSTFKIGVVSWAHYASAATVTKLWDVYVAIIDGSTSSTQPLNKANVYSGTASADKSLTIDAPSTTVEAGKSIKFEVRFIPNADLKATDEFKVTVSASGKIDGNTVSTSSTNGANVKVMDKASATIVAQTAKNKIIFPGVSTEIAAFDLNIKNDSAELTKVELTVSSNDFSTDDVSDLTIDFGGSVWAPSLTWENTNATTITASFDNTVTLPVDNYKVKVYATFDESALKTTAQGKRTITKVNLLNAGSSVTSWTLAFGHYVAKAYPVLTRESFSREKDNWSLELGVTKVEKNGLSAVVKIDNLSGNYVDAGGTGHYGLKLLNNPEQAGDILKKASNSLDLNNIGTSKGLIRGSYKAIAVKAVTFSVEEDGVTNTYTDIDVDSIADFATLTNE